jgi:hypothetical protein
VGDLWAHTFMGYVHVLFWEVELWLAGIEAAGCFLLPPWHLRLHHGEGRLPVMAPFREHLSFCDRGSRSEHALKGVLVRMWDRPLLHSFAHLKTSLELLPCVCPSRD